MKKSGFELIFYFVFLLTVLMIVAYISLLLYTGATVVNEVREHNGSIGRTIGSFVHEIKEGMETGK
jgi:hypothetical protein